MSERVPTLWKKDAQVAVAGPYPNVVGGVPAIRRDENIFLNQQQDISSVEVMPRMSWEAPRWETARSMSAGYAVHADPAKYGTDAWYSKPDPRDLPKLSRRVVEADFVDWHEPAMDWNAYMVGLMRAWHPRNHEMVIMGNYHPDTTEENMRRFLWASRLANFFGFMDVAITNSVYMKEKVEKVLGDGNNWGWTFEVIPNPVDRTLYTPHGPKLLKWGDQRLGDDVVKIFYIGRHEGRKGLIDALDAIAKMSRDPDGPKNFRFIVAGSGPDEQKVREMAEQLGLQNKVIFPGKISDEEKYKAYRSADICYFPSWTGESFGDVLMEAMASGVPVVAGMGYQNSPVMKPGENGFLLRSRGADEAAGYLTKLINSRELRKYMGHNAYESVQRFDDKIVYGQRIDLANETHSKKMKEHAKQKVVFHPYALAVGTALVTSSYTAGKRVIRGRD